MNNPLIKNFLGKFLKCIELNENENTSKLWNTGNIVLTGRSIAANIYTRKEITQINNLSIHLQKLEIEDQNGPKQEERFNKDVRNQ